MPTWLIPGNVITYVLAEQVLATTAVEAVTAKLSIVGADTVTDLELLDFLQFTKHNLLASPIHPEMVVP